MDHQIRQILWNQFGAAIDMLENAIANCPENTWSREKYWYWAYHTLFYLDYYSSDPNNFNPPAPFTLSEFVAGNILPERTYSKNELLDYLHYGRDKARRLMAGLTAENAAKRFINERRNYSTLEIIIYNMRHVQHHTAQLNLLLRQHGQKPPGWIAETQCPLPKI